MADRTIHVEVVYVDAEQTILRHLDVAENCTSIQAIDASGIIDMLPEGVLNLSMIGIFSRKVTPDCVLLDGDRIEIYRRLLVDPMEARRRRAR